MLQRSPTFTSATFRAAVFAGQTLALIILLLVAEACGDGTGPEVRNLRVVSGDAQSGVVAEPLRDSVTVRLSKEGRPVAGEAVTWSVAGGGGSVSPASTQTDAQGLARAEWTMGTQAGQASLIARASNVVEVTLTAEAGPGPPVGLGLEPGLVVLAVGGEAQVQTNLEDRFGNSVDSVETVPVSRNPDVVTASSAGKLSAWTPGAAFVLFQSGDMTDSAAVVVVEPDGFAVLVQPELDDWNVEVSSGEVVDLGVFLIAPEAGTGNLASVQGMLTWDASQLDFQSSGAVGGGPEWISNHDGAQPGTLKFVAYTPEGFEKTFVAGTVQFRIAAVDLPMIAPIQITLHAAGTETGSRVSDKLIVAPATLDVLP